MPLITIKTEINAPLPLVFDLARSIDLHAVSMAHTGEKAVAGKMSGLVELNDWVEWRAKHFGMWQNLSSKITDYKHQEYFVDEMQKGAFNSFRHQHLFSATAEGTIMTDLFDYKAPLGLLGKLADLIFLEKYMTRFITERNQVIKEFAEKGRWGEVIGNF